jgi:hypothetical protein
MRRLLILTAVVALTVPTVGCNCCNLRGPGWFSRRQPVCDPCADACCEGGPVLGTPIIPGAGPAPIVVPGPATYSSSRPR